MFFNNYEVYSNLFQSYLLTSLAHTSGGIQSEVATSLSPTKVAQVRHKGVNPFTASLLVPIPPPSLWLWAFFYTSFTPLLLLFLGFLLGVLASPLLSPMPRQPPGLQSDSTHKATTTAFNVLYPPCHDPSHGGFYMAEGMFYIRIGLSPRVVSGDRLALSRCGLIDRYLHCRRAHPMSCDWGCTSTFYRSPYVFPSVYAALKAIL